MKKVLAPPHIPMPHELLFPTPGIPNWKEGKLTKSDILEMISLFQAQLKSEPNIIKIQDPVTVVGDLHG